MVAISNDNDVNLLHDSFFTNKITPYMPTNSQSVTKASWTFLTNHFHVLVVLARDRESRVRDIAAEVGITQRAVQRIIAELNDDGIINVEKMGRRNSYKINHTKLLKHPLESQHTVGELLNLLS